jgi:transcriptional regulator with XRE-family HTH domain
MFLSKKEIGRRIRRIREDLGLEQDQFAELLQVRAGQPQVSRWENGESQPVTETLIKIATLGGRDLDLFQVADADDVVAAAIVAEARTLEGPAARRKRFLRVYSLTAALEEMYGDGTTLEKLEQVAKRVMAREEYKKHEVAAVGRWFEATRKAEHHASKPS